MNELINLDIEKINKGLINKDFSCVDLANTYLEQIDKTDDRVKSYVEVLKTEAINQAQDLDKNIIDNTNKVLCGVPGAIKEVIATKDTNTTACANILKNYKAPYNATCVKALQENNFVNLGKVNCDAFAHGISTENSDFFISRNPFDLSRVPGGSSGGSATAVAARQALFALGTDTGGSVRLPASFSGVVGLKPTYGRISRYGLFSMVSSTDCVGVLARSVLDSAHLLKVMAGHDEKDATSNTKKVDDYPKLIKEKQDLKGLRIGIPKEYFKEGIDKDVLDRVNIAVKELENLGANIVEVSLPNTDYALGVYYIIMSSEVSSNLARFDGIKYGYSANNDENIKPQINNLADVYNLSRQIGFAKENKRRIMLGTYALSTGYYDKFYNKATKIRQLINDDFAKAFNEVDILATPVSPTVAYKIGEKKTPLQMYLQDIFTTAVSLAGLPAISVPCGFSRTSENKELPIGLQLIANKWQETDLLSTAYLYEQINNYASIMPPIS